MDKKIRYIYPLRDPSQIKRCTQTKSKVMENIFDPNGKGKKAGVAVLIAHKIEFKTKNVIRDKEGHYIMIKGIIQHEDITLVNIYTLNIGTLSM